MNYTMKGRAVPMKPAVVKEVETVQEIPIEVKPVVEEKPLDIPTSNPVKDQLNVRPVVLKPKERRNNIRFVI